MNILKLGAWSGPLFQILFAIGWILVANMFPLHLPSSNAGTIATFFAGNATAVKLGCVIIWFSLMLCALFFGTISAFIRKVQNEAADMLANTQMLGGAFNLFAAAYPTYLWVTIAFRPDRSAEIIYALNDFAWLMLVAPFWCVCIQVLSLAIAIFVDKTPTPVFPRWYGFFSLWVVFLSLPGALVPFFYSGPFAWNGILGLWLPALVFAAFLFTTTYVFLQVLKNEKSEGSASAVE